jgi:hypothetical protein
MRIFQSAIWNPLLMSTTSCVRWSVIWRKDSIISATLKWKWIVCIILGLLSFFYLGKTFNWRYFGSIAVFVLSSIVFVCSAVCFLSYWFWFGLAWFGLVWVFFFFFLTKLYIRLNQPQLETSMVNTNAPNISTSPNATILSNVHYRCLFFFFFFFLNPQFVLSCRYDCVVIGLLLLGYLIWAN